LPVPVFDYVSRAGAEATVRTSVERTRTPSMKDLSRRHALWAIAAITGAIALYPLESGAVTTKPGPPVATTGKVNHVRGSSATLNGTVQPHGLVTNYYFQYGPTVAYGSQTTAASLSAGYTRIKVGQAVTGLRLGEHYRLVAINGAGTSFGRDRTYATKSLALKFSLPKTKGAPPTIYGGTYVLRGSLTGVNSAFHRVTLQASPYPYLEPFASVGAPVTTSATGGFTLRVTHMAMNTQLRVATLDPRPVLSPVVTAHVAVKVTLKVRTSKRAKGFVRLYGTVTPAKVGVPVAFQVLKAIRPGRSERETAFGTQFSTTTKRYTHSVSRFSLITKVRRKGRYRAFVQLHKGPLVSGASSTVLLEAAPQQKRSRKR
jgi:hypothetical protein